MKQNCHVSSAYSARSATGKRVGGRGPRGRGRGRTPAAKHPKGGLEGRGKWEACSFIHSFIRHELSRFSLPDTVLSAGDREMNE